MAVYRIQAPNGKIYTIEGPENADQNMLYGYVQQQMDQEAIEEERRSQAGIFSTFGRGVARGAGELASTFTDIIPAAVGSALGFEDYAREQLKEAEEKKAEREAKYPTLFKSYKEIGGLGDFAKYAAETVGEQVANIGTSLIPGVGLGSFAGRRAATAVAKEIAEEVAKKGLVGEAAKAAELEALKAAAPGLARTQAQAQAAGIYLGSYAQNAPEVFQNIYENNNGQLAPGAAALFGAVAAALDAVLPSTLAKQLTAPVKVGIVEKVLEKSGMEPGLLRSITAGTLKGVGFEGLTEGAQEAISIAAERFVSENPKVFGSKEWDRIVESAIKGAIAGGAFGSVGGGVEGLRPKEKQELEKNFASDRQTLKANLEKQEAPVVPGEPAAPVEPAAPPVLEQQLAAGNAQEEAQARMDAATAQARAQIEADRQRIEALKAEQEAQQKAAPAPVTLETIQKIDDPVAFGKLLGIGRTALILKPDGPLAGLDVSTPEGATAAKQVLEAYAGGNRSGKIATAVSNYITTRLDPVIAKGVTDVTGLDQQPSGAGTEVPSGGAVGTVAGTVEPVERGGVDLTGGDADQLAGRKAAEPGALTSETVQIPIGRGKATVETQRYWYHDPRKRGLTKEGGIAAYDLPPKEKELAGMFRGASPEDKFVYLSPAPLSENSVAVDISSFPERVRQTGQAEGYAIVRGDIPASAIKTKTQAAPAPQAPEAQVAPAPAAPKPPKKPRAAKAAEPVAPVEPEMTPEEAAYLADLYGEEKAPVEERGAIIRRKKATPEELRALEKEGMEATKGEAIYTKTRKKLSLPKYQGPVFNEAQRKLAEAGDVNGLLRNFLDSIQDPAIKQVLRRLRSLNLKTKLEIGDPTGAMALPVFSKFYSALGRGIEGVNIKSATPQGWKDAIKGLVNKGQAKQEEVEWTGINDWLDLQEGRVSKEQVVDYLKKEGVQVEEVVFGGPKDTREYGYLEERDGSFSVIDENETRVATGFDTLRDVIVEITKLRETQKPQGVKFQEHTLPGGENYREVLLTLPAVDKTVTGSVERDGKDDVYPWAIIVNGEEVNRVSKENVAYEVLQSELSRAREKTAYKSSHFPGIKNPAVHVRLNDRIDADGKRVLFVEEIQSDWGQEGRKRGFRESQEKELELLISQRDKIDSEMEAANTPGERIALRDQRAIVQAKINNLGAKEPGVPIAPFVTKTEGWLNLALKKVMVMAAEGGYDRVAFINGEQSADRYDLSKQVDSIVYAKESGGSYSLVAMKDGREAVKRDAVAESALPDLVGKEVADRIIKGEGKSLVGGPEKELTGENLKVGGEGMKTFYDQIVPNAVKKLLPKVGGGQMGKVEISLSGDASNNAQMPWNTATVRSAIQRGGEVYAVDRDLGGEQLIRTEEDLQEVLDQFTSGNQPEAFIYGDNGGSSTQPGFDVTPEMRSVVETKGVPLFYGNAGSYDPATNTITLDPTNGLNAHTFIHEVLHAAISNVLANENHPLTKQFQKFFVSIQDRLGAAYGATDLQEFAAELVSNPSFQAVLKSIKAPKSENMFMRVLRSIAEFFGFAPKTTAFEKGLKFINDAIDITNDVPATAAQRLFLGDGTNQSEAVNAVQEAQPSLVGRKVEETRNFLSNLSGSEVLRLAFGLMRLDNLYNLYKKELPSIKVLLDALEKRVGTEEKSIEHASENFKKFAKIQKQYPAAMRVLNDLAIKISDAQVDVLAKTFEYRLVDTKDWVKMTDKQRNDYQMVEAQRKRDYNALKPQFDALPEPVKELYKAIRNDFDAAFNRYRAILEKAAEGSPAVLAKLREEFTLKQPLIGYIPFRRYGDFWLEFTDPDTDTPVTMAFESIRERQKFIDEQLKNIPHDPRRPRYVAYNKFEDIKFDGSTLPPTHFLNDVIKKLRSEGASDAQVNAVYQSYLAAFPAESIAKQFMKRVGTRGMEADIVRGYNDLMVRWSRRLANSEYLPQIDRAIEQIKQEGQAHQRETGGDPAIGAAVQNILDQRAFFHNPTYNTLVSSTAQLSFFEFMAGNISSAVINLTSLPLMVYPLLTGKFGWADVGPAMFSAMNEAKNDWGAMGKYKKLYETLDDHGQLKHTMAREVLEARRQKSEDYTGAKARFMNMLALPFSMSERWNRATTAIASYNLALKKGMSEQEAIDYALETVKTAHTSGMAVTGPRWMQTPLGRMFFTFKSILWQQGYVLARAFYQAFKGESKEVRDAARRQLLATYGMATVFVGAKGMPFYGAVSVLAEILASMFGDDDEPFDFNEFMRGVFGEFLYKGAFNYFTNLEVANRAGLATDLVFRDDPRGIAEHGYALSAMQQMFGPVGSIFVNAERAVKMFKDGHYERSLETVMPSFVRNGMKGIRYLNEGAVTLKGDPIDTDISVWNSTMQLIGFAPADLSNKYEMLQMGKGFERAVELRRRDALRLYDLAVRSGDSELMSEVRERIQSFNEKHPKYRITQDSLRRSTKAREAAEKDMIYGVRFNKNLRGEIKERFFEE